MVIRIQQAKILLIDDHLLFAEGLKATLRKVTDESNIDILRDPIKYLRQLDHKQSYDLVIVDLQMPDIDGLDLIEKLLEHDAKVRILVVSANTDSRVASKAIGKGAMGYVCKSSEVSVIVSAVKTILDGGTFVSPVLSNATSFAVTTNAAQGVAIPPRTSEVLNQMARGHSNKVIADLLSITEPTVKWHVTQLFEILSVKNRTACVAKAAQQGLVDIGS